MPVGLSPNLKAPPAGTRKTSLLTVAQEFKQDPEDPTWEMGGQFVPEACQSALAQAHFCESGQPDLVLDDCSPNRDDIIEVDAFTVYQPYSGPATAEKLANYPSKAQKLLDITAAKTVEFVYWTGNETDDVTAAGTNIQQLAQPGPLVPATDPGPELIDGGAAQSTSYGLRSLVQYIATNSPGGRGIIHASPSVVFDWHAAGHLLWENGRWTEATSGHYVVSGAGYPGSGPGNVPTGNPLQQWAYATGQMFWSRTQVSVTPDADDGIEQQKKDAFDRLQNRFNYFAHQTYLLWRDPCIHAGVLMNLQTSAGAV